MFLKGVDIYRNTPTKCVHTLYSYDNIAFLVHRYEYFVSIISYDKFTVHNHSPQCLFFSGKCVYERGREADWTGCDASNPASRSKTLKLVKVRGEVTGCPEVKVIAKPCKRGRKNKNKKNKKNKEDRRHREQEKMKKMRDKKKKNNNNKNKDDKTGGLEVENLKHRVYAHLYLQKYTHVFKIFQR